MTAPALAPRSEPGAVVAAALAGDESAFATLAEHYRSELQAHVFRMLGSSEDSEDVVQEALLRAWRGRGTFRGRSSFRAWLYGIATNASLTVLEQRARRRRVQPGLEGGASHVDALARIEAVPASGREPEADVAERETLELAFLAAVRHLPPRQRAVLFLGDVLGWSARDSATLLRTSVASVNSARQRARATLRRRLPVRRLEWGVGPEPSGEEQRLLRLCLDAAERGDADALVAMAGEQRGER